MFAFDSFCLHTNGFTAEVMFGQITGDAICNSCGEVVFMGNGPGVRPRGMDQTKITNEAIFEAIEKIFEDKTAADVVEKTTKSGINSDGTIIGQYDIRSIRTEDFHKRAMQIKKRLESEGYTVNVTKGDLRSSPDSPVPSNIKVIEIVVKKAK